MRQFLLIKVAQRLQSAPEVQKVLTDYGQMILVRLGLHEQELSAEGIIFLEVDPKGNVVDMVRSLENISGVTVKLIEV
ncbi:hypothetical protein [Thermospira aquatica]|uniref:Iron-only hydrogenase system regulator n=1 Tax=Thermospira aquatica TaxID=2828656 RepID=A0AAX3BEM4_9SPIR|nr:hypothetical protein [Thermospira aquatica]URA10676.1 hypothetical protein KDW03_02410 [Thermospira aquatica]